MDAPDTRNRTHKRYLLLSIFAVGAAGTAMLAFSMIWNVRQVRNNTLEEAAIQARMAYEEDLVFRRWNMLHGGVYVPITDSTRPDPYLSQLPDRDVTTDTGRALTLINPASMTRQAHEMAADVHAHTVQGRITSLEPRRRENGPDDWEAGALEAFEDGVREVSSAELVEGKETFRLMRPLRVEEGCLRCHHDQGLIPGQLYGGISVSVPMAPLRVMESSSIFTLNFAHGALWLVGIAALALGSRTLLGSERARAAAEAHTMTYAMRLEESSRLKDLFTDIMRHDLLNPAVVIKYYAEFIVEGQSDAKTRECGAKIRKATGRLIQMIESASQLSRLREMEQVECCQLDLGSILREAVREMDNRLLEEGVEVIYRPRGYYPVRANHIVGDVFANLLTNALKYAGQGGKIEVDIESLDGNLTVSVKDYGEGVPDGDKDKVFSRFERLQKQGVQGSGLGLAIARQIVELHEGRIWVEDNPEGGAVFKVRLPEDGPTEKGRQNDRRESAHPPVVHAGSRPRSEGLVEQDRRRQAAFVS